MPTFQAQSGRIYVAADLGMESARAFVAQPADSNDASLKLFEDAATTTAATTPKIEACPLVSPFAQSGELAASAAPVADCSKPVSLTRSQDGSWMLSLAELTGLSTFGVAIVPKLDTAATFHLSFDTARTTVVAPPAAVPAPAVPDAPVHQFVAPPTPEVLEPVPDAPVAAPPVAQPVPTAPTPRPAGVVDRASAATPPAGVVLPLVALGVAALFFVRRSPLSISHGGSRTQQPRRVGMLALAAAAFLPLLFSEATVYKTGLVLIVIVAATGLHLLVNWAGELSLAHAALIGLPAFIAAQLSASIGISPIFLVPVAAAIGLAAGVLIGVPAIRARGLQVAVVTLAAGVSVDRFFFTKSWIIGGSGGAHVDVPTLGPLRFTSARALYPVLIVFVGLAVAASWAIYRSKVGRSFLWTKAQPEAAAAFGIPVARYRMLAYAAAGAFAGFAGGLTTMWVQRLTPQAFPLSLSFTYLIIVALAGRGFVGGVAVAAAFVEGGRLFMASGGAVIAYLAPAGLILTLTQHRAGLNGLGRQVMERIKGLRKETVMSSGESQPSRRVHWWAMSGVVAVATGFAAIGLAWYHLGNTSQVWIQNQELLSGGIGGLALVVLGVGLLIVDRIGTMRARPSAPHIASESNGSNGELASEWVPVGATKA